MIDGATLPSVKSIRAHVRNGQIVPDEPVELPEGAAVEVLVELEDDFAMTPEEIEEHERELDLSKAEIARGEFIDARELSSRLGPRS
jgi:predicted DNA-binding antitoxin AbrB/MazE fold protein